MSKFNFQNYQEKISEDRLSLDSFKPIKPGGFGSARRETKPIVSVTRNAINLNSAATRQIIQYGKYVEFMLHADFLVMRFLPNKTPSSYTLNLGKSEASASTGASVVLKLLQENTDLINLHIYRYRFELKNDEENIYFLELKNPYERIRSK